MTLDQWATANRSRALRSLLVGLGLVIVGISCQFLLDRHIDHRIETGIRVVGVVQDVDTFPVGRVERAQRITVEFSLGGETYNTKLMSSMNRGDYRRGQQVELFADRENPFRVATRSRFASEDVLMRVPPIIAIIGACVILVVLVAWWQRARKERRRRRFVQGLNE